MRTDPTAWRVFTATIAVLMTAHAAAQFGVPASTPQTEEPVDDDVASRAAFGLSEAAFNRSLEPRWRLRFSPTAYYVAPEGDLTLPGSSITRTDGLSGDLATITSLNLDSPRVSPYGAIEVARDKLTLRVAGFSFGSERETTTPITGRYGDLTLFSGEGIESELDYQNVDATLRYRLLDYADGELIPIDDDFSGYKVQATLEAVGGLRFQRFATETRVTTPAAGRIALPTGSPISTDYDAVFAEPIVGGRITVDLWQRMRIGFTVTGGYLAFGDRSAASVDLDANFAFRVIDEAQLLIGYRLLTTTLEDGDDGDEFEFDGSFAGLYVGLQTAF